MSEQNTTEPDSPNVDALNARIAAILIESPSATDQEIATTVGLSRQSVNRRRNSPVVQELVRSALAIPEREVRRLTAKALLRLEKLLDDDDPKIRLAATLSLVKLSARLMTNSFEEALLAL
jgi:hypothetical protein